MIKAMNILLIIALSFTISCNQPTSKEKTSLNFVEFGQIKQNKIDSVVIKYWKSTEANEYFYKYSNGELKIYSQYFGVNINSSDILTIDKFITYVNEFYIDRNEKIILEKNIRKNVVSSEYSSIIAIGYKRGKELFREQTQIGYEEYDVKFSPKFLEFYEFLNSFINEK